MQIHLPPLSAGLNEFEDGMRERLFNAREPDDDVQFICACFARILSEVFQSLQKGDPRRGWCVDDLWCETVKCARTKVTFDGPSYWLKGGVNCHWFQLDVALDTDPLLYSYKFTKGRNPKIGSKIHPVLYIGKHPKGWTINHVSV